MELLVLGAVVLAIVLVLWGTVRTGVPPMPTSAAVRACMFELSDGLAPATVYELGAGWGGLASALARRWPEAKVVAVEVSPLPWSVSWMRQALFGPANLEVRFADVLKTDLGSADLCVCFLCPPAMARLARHLEEALKPGAYVLSNSFALPGWTPARQMQVDDPHRSAVYLYQCEVAGESKGTSTS